MLWAPASGLMSPEPKPHEPGARIGARSPIEPKWAQRARSPTWKIKKSKSLRKATSEEVGTPLRVAYSTPSSSHYSSFINKFWGNPKYFPRSWQFQGHICVLDYLSCSLGSLGVIGMVIIFYSPSYFFHWCSRLHRSFYYFPIIHNIKPKTS